jgi:uncharacterized repeat protein (TIGR02059 family)
MKKLLFTIFAAALLMSGCNKSENPITNGGAGRLIVKITDDPFNISYVESATVTITKIEVRKSGANDGDPFIVLSENPVTIDLFQLRNGITDELVNLEVPIGDYDLIRLYISESGLKLKEHAEQFTMKVPSGEQTGIKVFISPEIHVEGGISAELLLDFDLSKSFVMRGNMEHSAGVNGFIFKPVIRATNKSTSGRIEGVVTDNSPEKVAIENATVSLQQESGDPFTTYTDESGHYAFIGVPAGTYSVSAEKENYITENAEGIVVFPGNKVIRDFTLTAIPVYVSSVIENASPNLLAITFNLTLDDIVPDAAAFTVTVTSVERAVNSIVIADNKVLLTLASPVAKDEIVTVEYTKPSANPLQTPDGIQAASFTAQNVTNKVGI